MSAPALDDRLAAYLTPDEPLGPGVSPDSDRELLDALYSDQNEPHKSARHEEPSFIFGRKGAGKTALLLGPLGGPLGTPNLVQLGERTAFRKMKQLAVAHSDRFAATFTEDAAEVWIAGFWHVAVSHAVRTASKTEVGTIEYASMKEYLGASGPGVSADDDLEIFFDTLLESLESGRWRSLQTALDSLTPSSRDAEPAVTLGEATRSAEKMIRRRSRHGLVLTIDSLEDLQYEILELETVLRGLFRAVGELSRRRRPVLSVRCCFPTELLDDLSRLSSNPDKDFRHRIFVQWSAAEIVTVVAKRIQLFLQLHDADANRELTAAGKLDARRTADAKRIVRFVLPPTDRFMNRAGEPEEPLGYIMRHTQLLPRHALLLFAEIIRQNRAQGGTSKGLHAEIVQHAVSDIEPDLVRGIINAYNWRFPHANLPGVMGAGLSGLPSEFTVQDLENLFNKRGIRKDYNLAFYEFVRLLANVGAIGVSEPELHTEVYVVGRFQYTYNNPATYMNLGSNVRLCLHPIFSGTFGGVRNGGEGGGLPVYPYGSRPEVDF
ncbi:MAG: hypothetical protein AAGD18_09720 [Actinomycetota bacterium]